MKERVFCLEFLKKMQKICLLICRWCSLYFSLPPLSLSLSLSLIKNHPISIAHAIISPMTKIIIIE